MKSTYHELEYFASFTKINEQGRVEEGWGCNIYKEGREVFTVELAKELLDIGIKVYEENFGKNIPFNHIKLDMSQMVEDLSQYNIDGEHPQYYIGAEKFGTYDKRKNILRIWRNGIPIYENNNGKICKDEDALADSLL